MKKAFYLVIITLVATTGVLVFTLSGSDSDIAAYQPTRNKPAGATTVADGGGQFGLFCMEKAVTYGNLRLVPVCADAQFLASAQRKCNYVPLKQALLDNKVSITEREMSTTARRRGGAARNELGHVIPNPIQTRNLREQQNQNEQELNASTGGGNAVNELTIENNSGDTVYVMGGEVVKGGLQDRIIAQDMVLPPHSGPMAMQVFCVEHGRWSARDASVSREEAVTFTGYSNVGASSVRKRAVMQKDQGQVWQEVAKVNEANDVSTGTGTYTALEEAPTYQHSSAGYLSAFRDLARNNPNMIGVIAISGDKVIACDIFSCPDLFAKEFEGLLRSYIAEAVSYGQAAALSDEQVKDYFAQFVKEGKLNEKKIAENGAMAKDSEGDWTHLNMY